MQLGSEPRETLGKVKVVARMARILAAWPSADPVPKAKRGLGTITDAEKELRITGVRLLRR